MPEQELTRRAMYDLVWSRPMTKVAEDLGISDVALKKICDKHRVPTPPRGYWAKRDAGKPTKQVQFHSTSDPQHEHIVIHGSRNNLAPEIREVLEQERERRKSKPKTASPAEVAPIVPPQDVHPAISATAKALRKAKPDADEVIGASGHGCCGIEVGAASLERTIAVLDSIARALDARGLKVEPIGNCMRVALPPDSLTFSLVERIEKRNHCQPWGNWRERSSYERSKNATIGLEYGRSIENGRIPNSTSSVRASSAFKSQINMLEDFVVAGVTGSGRKSRVS
jgi:hypothetical protein